MILAGNQLKRNKAFLQKLIQHEFIGIDTCVHPSLFEDKYLLSLIMKEPTLVRTLPYYLQIQHRFTITMLQMRLISMSRMKITL